MKVDKEIPALSARIFKSSLKSEAATVDGWVKESSKEGDSISSKVSGTVAMGGAWVTDFCIGTEIVLAADLILATSNTIVKAIHEVVHVNTVIIPFGVDINYFKPKEVKEPASNEIVVGTVKSLEEIYGIDVLIKAFKILINFICNR